MVVLVPVKRESTVFSKIILYKSLFYIKLKSTTSQHIGVSVSHRNPDMFCSCNIVVCQTLEEIKLCG